MTELLNLGNLLHQLIQTWENEVIEFKEAGNDYSTDKIGQYFSALANEANLRGHENAWLVFGVSNLTRQIVGTNYRTQPERLQSLKMQINQNTDTGLTFRHIYDFQHPQGRVILFKIPSAPRGIPISWKGHYYARAGESLVSLGLDKLDEIRQQTLAIDWSAQTVNDAALEHLDTHAVEIARKVFVKKYANRFSQDEIMNWSIQTFLDRARLIQNGKITRTALLLLGKRESAYLLSPHPVEITWRLLGTERDYEHFGPPFFLNTTRVFQKIRNTKIRITPDNALLPAEIPKYDSKIVLEALHNCIAHQDYNCNGRIIVSEYSDKLCFENEGNFFEGQPDDYLTGEKTPRRYRNPFLIQAMAELNMIDTMGYGIFQIHKAQAARFLPMPDYDLSEPNVVSMTIYGNIVNPAYSKLLMENTQIAFSDILALDRVQKKLPISDETVRRLKRQRLIEGRKPNFHISSTIAKATKSKAKYIKTRRQDDAFYKKLILDYITQFGEASRKDIDDLLMDKLSGSLNFEQKVSKIGNLLTNLRRAKQIKNNGSRKAPKWIIAE